MALDDDGMRVGKRGGSLSSTSDAFGWAVGDLERKTQENLRRGVFHGNDSPNTLQIILLYIATGMLVVLLLALELVPSVLVDDVWPLAAIWFAGSTVLYFILKFLPRVLSGVLAGGAIGFEAGYLAQLYTEWHWALGIGLATAAIMYFLFSSLR